MKGKKTKKNWLCMAMMISDLFRLFFWLAFLYSHHRFSKESRHVLAHILCLNALVISVYNCLELHGIIPSFEGNGKVKQ